MKKAYAQILFTVGIVLATSLPAWAAANLDSVTVGNQSGPIVYGNATSVTYGVVGIGTGKGLVTWSVVSALPSGAVASFSPASSTENTNTSGNNTWNTTLTITSATNTPAGSYSVIVSGVGNTTRNGTNSLVVGILTVTPNVTVLDKVYDGNTSATIVGRSLAGAATGSDVTLTGGTASFEDKNVGVDKQVTATGLSLSGADAGNYSLALDSATTTASITAVEVSGSIAVADKVYDGTTDATITNGSVTGVVGGEDVTLTGGTASFEDKNVGADKQVTATGLSLSGADAGNYTLASDSATTTASITAAEVSGSIAVADKVYDGTTDATITNWSLTGVVGGEDVTLIGGTASFEDKNVGADKQVTATGLSLSGADAGNYSLALDSATTTASITAASLVVSATGVDKAYDGTTDATVTLGDDRVSGDDLSLSYGSASFEDKDAGVDKTVNVTGISVSGTDAGNYTLASDSAMTTASITAAEVSGSIVVADKMYDGTTDATITNGSVTGVVGGEDVTLTGGTASFEDKNVGADKQVTATGLSLSGADAGNYSLALDSATTTASITAAELTVTADDNSRVYGAPDPEFTVTYSGFVAGEGEEVLSGSPEISTTAIASSPVAGSPYPITVTNGTLSAVNYVFNFADGELTISPADMAIALASSLNPVPTGSNVTLTATLSAVSPSTVTPEGTVQFLVDDSPFGAPVTVSNGMVQLDTSALDHGYRAIAAMYTGDGNFNDNTSSLDPELLVNTAPAAMEDALVTWENTATNVAAVDLQANDSDDDDDSLDITEVSTASAQGGVVSLLAGVVIYQPPTSFTGADSFTYTLTDTFGATSTGTVNVTVVGVTNIITAINMLPDGNTRVTIAGTPGLTYVLEATTNLSSPAWEGVNTNAADGGGQAVIDDLNATNSPARYYRCVLP